VFLRPEVAVLIGILGIVAVTDTRHPLRSRLAWVGGAGLLVLAWLSHNLAVYGLPLGLHAQQVLVDGAPTSLGWREGVDRGLVMGRLLLLHGVEFWLLIVLACCVALPGVGTRDERVVTWGAVVVFLVAMVGVAFVVPNFGGLQYGPRYLLVALPVVWVGVIAGVAAARRHKVIGFVVAIAACVMIVWGGWLNGILGLRAVDSRHNGESRNLVRAIVTLQPDVVAVGQQDIALETASLWSSIPYVRATGTSDLAQIASALDSATPYKLLWVMENRNVPDAQRFAVPYSGGELRCSRLPAVGPSYVSFRCDNHSPSMTP
jgi:hypothetical protein